MYAYDSIINIEDMELKSAFFILEQDRSIAKTFNETFKTESYDATSAHI